MNDQKKLVSATLVSAEALAAAIRRDDLVVIDTRFDLAGPDVGEAAWRDARIPGARYAHLDRDLSDHRKPGQGRHPWPDAGDFTAALGRWGITPAHQVVAYDAADGALAAARLWFLLRTLGHERVAVLDGGWKRWTALGLPVGADPPTSPTPAGRYPGTFDTTRLLDATQVQAHLAGGGLLVDARAGERFRGDVEPIDLLAGHVPGALNRPYADNLRDGLFKPAPALADEFADVLGGQAPGALVAMCGSGVTACHHLLAMEHAGLHGGRLFTGSWSGWIEDPSRPVALGGSPSAPLRAL
jgi:thiosulfate/3-mercaptopyruvate sulfurtransferase